MAGTGSGERWGRLLTWEREKETLTFLGLEKLKLSLEFDF